VRALVFEPQIARFAAAKVMARPALNQLTPGGTVAQGVADYRLTLVAHGESRLLARGDEDDAHAQNRRVQFTVMEIGGRPVRSR
jgi:flagellar motor protein MotB